MTNQEVFTKILQGATRKALRGQEPFKPLSEPDPLVKEFTEDFEEAAPIFRVNFRAVVEPVINEELASL